MGRFSFIVLFVSFTFTGCLVKEQCYNDADCSSPEICKDGGCVFECKVDTDCDDKFGIEFVCEINHCRYPNECVTCSFPNAHPSCIHGQCGMGDCCEGFLDLNGDTADGCEYACIFTNNGVEKCDQKDNNCVESAVTYVMPVHIPIPGAFLANVFAFVTKAGTTTTGW